MNLVGDVESCKSGHLCKRQRMQLFSVVARSLPFSVVSLPGGHQGPTHDVLSCARPRCRGLDGLDEKETTSFPSIAKVVQGCTE